MKLLEFTIQTNNLKWKKRNVENVHIFEMKLRLGSRKACYITKSKDWWYFRQEFHDFHWIFVFFLRYLQILQLADVNFTTFAKLNFFNFPFFADHDFLLVFSFLPHLFYLIWCGKWYCNPPLQSAWVSSVLQDKYPPF